MTKVCKAQQGLEAEDALSIISFHSTFSVALTFNIFQSDLSMFNIKTKFLPINADIEINFVS